MPAPQPASRDRTDLEFLRLGAVGKPRQMDVARRMKASKSTVSLFESGAREVSEDFISAYAKALNVPVKEVKRRYWATRADYCGRAATEARKALRIVSETS